MGDAIEVTRRGQITIPKKVRNALGIQEGQKYGLRALKGGVLVLIPRSGHATTALSRLRDTLVSKGGSAEEMLAELRRMRET